MHIKPTSNCRLLFCFLLSVNFAGASFAEEWTPPVAGQIHNQGPIVIKNVRVFDGNNPKIIENATVLIDYVRKPDQISLTGSTIWGYDIGYFIKEIASSKPLKTTYDTTRARVIDGKNKVLMPGLIDTHVHLSWANVDYLKGFSKKLNTPGSGLSYKDWLTEDKRDPADPDFVPNAIYASKQEAKAYLMRGFTSVREVGGVGHLARPSIDPVDALINPAERRGPSQLVLQQPGPRIWAAGSVISATAGHGDVETTLASQFKIIADPGKMTLVEREELVYQLDRFGFRTADGIGEVQHAVRNQFVKGVELIKITTGGGISSPHDPIDATTFSNDEVTAAVQVAEGYNTYVTTHAYGG
ncbi:MAG: amidohydrolase family protein, partial [Methylococcaceae bacterium]